MRSHMSHSVRFNGRLDAALPIQSITSNETRSTKKVRNRGTLSDIFEKGVQRMLAENVALDITFSSSAIVKMFSRAAGGAYEYEASASFGIVGLTWGSLDICRNPHLTGTGDNATPVQSAGLLNGHHHSLEAFAGNVVTSVSSGFQHSWQC